MNEAKTPTRDKILHAAIRLFQDYPYEEVSVKKICDAAGVTRNSFYYYFDTKDSIFDAIANWCVRSSRDKILYAPRRDTAYHQFWNFYHAYLSAQLELGPKIMNRVCVCRSDHLRSDYEGFIDEQLAEVMSDLIRQAQENKEILNDRDPLDLLWTSYATIRGVNIKWCFQWGKSDLLGESMEAMDDLFLPDKNNALAPERTSAENMNRFSY